MELQIYEKNGECVPLQFPHVHEKYLKTNDIGIMDTNDMWIKICHCFVADSLSPSLYLSLLLYFARKITFLFRWLTNWHPEYAVALYHQSFPLSRSFGIVFHLKHSFCILSAVKALCATIWVCSGKIFSEFVFEPTHKFGISAHLLNELHYATYYASTHTCTAYVVNTYITLMAAALWHSSLS